MFQFGEFYPCSILPEAFDGQPLLVAITGSKLLSSENNEHFLFEPEQLPVCEGLSRHLLGVYNQRPCYAVDVGGVANIPNGTEWREPGGLEWRELRSLLGLVDELHFNLAGRAIQIIQWDREHHYCGCCGRPTVVNEDDRSRACNHCDQVFYPRISPCVIVVVTKGDHCLLASNVAWEGRFYSALAGFIEPGETAESALHREVMEEVCIEVENLRYFGSQPWPFPGQLMIGFHATYKSGDIQVDNNEIMAADWWHYDDLPPCPETSTLSGQLIQSFVDSCREEGR